MSKEKKRFLLRIDKELYAVLEKWAADELRSINAQIEFLLSNAAKKRGDLLVMRKNKERIAKASSPYFIHQVLFSLFLWYDVTVHYSENVFANPVCRYMLILK